MIDCPQCQHHNPDDAIFCNKCGRKLEVECEKCGKVNPPASRFCNHCGMMLFIPSEAIGIQAVPESSQGLPIMRQPGSLVKGERRQVTTVFSDLSGYTSLNERLDPEEVEAIMSRIKKEAVKIVERLEGTVNQFVGDEVLALFGVPFAHEDDPVRAVLAAMNIHEVVRRISHEVEGRTRTNLRMHTGISTGLIVTQVKDAREGVEPTNNRAERAVRFGVLWRKRSLGSQSDKGLRWVERILSLKETCRLKAKAPFSVMVEMVSAYFKEQKPNLAWIG